MFSSLHLCCKSPAVVSFHISLQSIVMQHLLCPDQPTVPKALPALSMLICVGALPGHDSVCMAAQHRDLQQCTLFLLNILTTTVML